VKYGHPAFSFELDVETFAFEKVLMRPAGAILSDPHRIEMHLSRYDH